MKPFAILRCLGLCLVLSVPGGCAAISAVSSAGQQLESFELRALPPARHTVAGTRHLQLEPPTASGGLATNRIMIKPAPLQVEYLPGVRWVDEAPDHVQLLLSRSLTNTGRFALVSTERVRPDADYLLLTDLQAFQAEVNPADGTVRVVVQVKVTLVDDVDREIIAARSFKQVVPAAAPTVAQVVPAFDQAMLRVLQEITAWTVRMVG